MKLNAPKKVTWIIGLVLALAALVVKFAGLASGEVAFWLALVSACLMLCATLLSNL